MTPYISELHDQIDHLENENERLAAELHLAQQSTLLFGNQRNWLQADNAQLREVLEEAMYVIKWHMEHSSPVHDSDNNDFFNLSANAVVGIESALFLKTMNLPNPRNNMKQYTKSEVLEKLRDYFREINATSPERIYAGGLTESQVQFIGHADMALRETIHMTALNARTGRSFPKTVNA